MKIIRLTEDRYVIDVGPVVTAERLEYVKRAWEEWFAEHPTKPTAFTFGGISVPVEYEDRRAPDIEERLAVLEAAITHHRHS